jgi:hypothetical protein
MKDITVTARDGRVTHLDQVYIRGSHVRFFVVPDMLRYATRVMDAYCLGTYIKLVPGHTNTFGIEMHQCSDNEMREEEVLA